MRKATPRPGKPKKAKAPRGDSAAEVERLTRELAEAQAKLQQIETQGVDAFTARKMEALLEAAQVARGQALDASLARNKAEGELRALQHAIEAAPGPRGWLLRRAMRRLVVKP